MCYMSFVLSLRNLKRIVVGAAGRSRYGVWGERGSRSGERDTANSNSKSRSKGGGTLLLRHSRDH